MLQLFREPEAGSDTESTGQEGPINVLVGCKCLQKVSSSRNWPKYLVMQNAEFSPLTFSRGTEMSAGSYK